MKMDENIVQLRNGLLCSLRTPVETDAAEILQHIRQTSAETENMARYADEIIYTIEEEKEYLSKVLSDPKSIMISAFVEGKLVGNVGFSPIFPYERYRHRAEFGISIKKEFWGVGIGSALLQALFDAAKEADYEQLELEVVSDNLRAIALYEKMGFVIYGTRECSFKMRDGRYLAMHLMVKRL